MAKDIRKYRDRAIYLADAVAKRRRHLKESAVQESGGKCQICGYKRYTGALDFHHTNEKNKLFALNVRDMTKSWEMIVKEIHKCVLLCANCHREIHGGIIQLPQNRVL